ncbi:hypothetical protein ACLMJK_000668 [Lecanora helva]
MGQWAQMRSRKASSSHGWSAYGGQTVGAYYPQQDPSGSSSGSAVAPSVGLALGALGTETSGSIVLPAEKSNLVGIKPTLGLTSRSMVIPISVRQDTVGPMARTVKDAAYMLSAISGKDRNDNWTSIQPFQQAPDYVKACNHSALKRVRLGVPRNGISPFLTDQNAPIMAAFEKALEVITNAGARVWDDANFASFNMNAFHRNSSIVLDTDFASGLANYFSSLRKNPGNVRNLHDLANFTRSDPREGFPDRDVYVWDRVLGLNITNESSESYNAYKANLHMGDDLGVTGTLDKYNLDALVMPTFASFHLPAIAGLPVVTVPLGFFPPETPLAWNLKKTAINVAPQIPYGIAFVGRRWSEELLVSLAYAFEQRTLARQKISPYIAPTFELGDQVSHTARAARASATVSPLRIMRTVETVQALLKRSVKGLLSIDGWMWGVLGVFETME